MTRPALDPFMTVLRLGDRAAATLLGVLLLGIGFVAQDSGPPTVLIAEIELIEDGAVVRLTGVLVHAWMYDSGLETMLLADLEDGSTVKLAHQSSASPSYTSLLSIGDEVSSVGEVRRIGGSITVWVPDDGIRLTRRSEEALTVGAICRNWLLFEGDLLNVTGKLSEGDAPGTLALRDMAGPDSITVFDPPPALESMAGRVVTLECELVLSTEELRFGLEVSSFALSTA
jgi:hypothetical protein